ncbi:MAG: ATP-binding cassette domain-containing protein [Proteobacteria bacterium]|nr:ATP-binding cassette domain-containing protein [Pseudomonadota bacterium]
MRSPSFIELETVCYAYRKNGADRILHDINLKIRPDEYLLVCGASGSGKSTLCRTFNGLIPHFFGGSLQGDIRIDGIPTTEQSVGGLITRLGMVFQNPEAQLFNRSVEQEIAFGLESIGLERGEIKKRIAEAAAAAGIEGLLLQNPHELSGGQQQIVSIAAVLALRPQTIILDEPYANLDPVNVRRVRTALKKIHQNGIGIIVSEHRLALTVADAERMVVLHQGRIVLDGPPETILRQNIESYGLELPLAVTVGRQLGLATLPLEIDALIPLLPEKTAADFAPAPSPAFEQSALAAVLKIDRISFNIDGKSVLRDISFTVNAGECLALVGANGAGKTTLLKHLNGLIRPARGCVTVMNRSTQRLKVSQLARYVGVAFQNPNSQFFKLTVWDEIVVGAQALKCYDESWIRELVQLFELEPLLMRAPYRLSEGEKKRVAFAAALAARPVILALDEPTAGQDLFFRRSLGKLLAQLQQRGQAVLLITQDLSFAEQYAQRWLLLADGEIVADGSPGQVMKNQAAMERAHLEPTDRFRLFGLQRDPNGNRRSERF